MSVNGSKYPVLVLSFNNCELHCCHLDGYKNDKNSLLNRLLLIEDYFNKNPKSRRYRIWYNIDDSVIPKDTIEKIVQSILRIKDSIIKIAFVGANQNKRHLSKLLNKDIFDKPFHFFKDAELAKEWLV